MTRSIILSPEAVTEILTALHGCKSQLGDVANLAHAIKLMEEANEAPSYDADRAAMDVLFEAQDAQPNDELRALYRRGADVQRNGLTGLDGADEARFTSDDLARGRELANEISAYLDDEPEEEPETEEDMPPMPLMLDGDDDKSGGVATMAKDLLRGSRLGDRGRPKPKPYGAN